MPEPTGTYTLLPWVRQGAAAGSLPVDTMADTLEARASVAVDLRVDADTVGVKARLYGPGDVVGVDPRQIVRTDPRPRSANVETKYLASVEFARADFPWLFTPAAADAQGRLRPWLCLVVVRRRDGVRIFADQTRPLPTLEIASPARLAEELPDLAESWAWAHAQATGTALTGGGGDARSRLLCPRRLDPNTAYTACVVPTFEVGRLAGLGRSPTTDDLAPAWRIGDPPTRLELPVYYMWEFSTGAGEDFEALVRKLVARELPPTVGIRPMNVANADPDLPSIPPDSPDAVLGLEGALMSLRTQPKPFTTSIGPLFRDALRRRLVPLPASDTDPLVAPPIYGGRHANQTGLPPDGAAPNWLRDLNLDPRYRVVAALGTAVVQANQEELMAAAWEQLGDIERVNQLLRQAQLLRAANEAVHRNRLKQLPDGAALQVTRALHARFRGATTATLLVAMTANGASGSVSPAFRRIVRPRGPVVRRALPPALRTVRPVVQALATGEIAAFPAPPNNHVVTVESVEARLRAAGGTNREPGFISASNIAALSAAQVGFQSVWFVTPPNLPGGSLTAAAPGPAGSIGFPWGFDSPAAANFRAAMTAHQALIQPPQPLPYFSGQFDVNPVTALVLEKIDPAVTVTARANALVQFDGPRDARDPLEPIMAAPEFTTAMYALLHDLSQDLLLPGLNQVEDNTVALLRPNPRFIEAYMVGLNHEFARELLWRDYPTDQRGSYFRQFWDTRGAVPAAVDPDTPPLHQWPTWNGLGENLAAGTSNQLVLLIRGELLRRYPNPIVYAVRATGQSPDPQLGTQERYPLFRGSFEPDVAFFGFDLSEAQARGGGPTGDPGWFFVVQQHPTEPRFGLDVPPDEPYLRPQGNAATTALALTQRPVRVAIHATDLLP
jgi:hypothetical protein